jgi:hypothetical protein
MTTARAMFKREMSFVVKIADSSSDSLAPNGDGLIGHNL